MFEIMIYDSQTQTCLAFKIGFGLISKH